MDSTKCDKQSRQKVGFSPQGAIEMKNNVHMPVIFRYVKDESTM